jgi:outer membrane protein assembly factor BamB
MFMGGAEHSGRSSFRGPTTDPALRWAYRTTARIPASPVVGPDGTIYIGSSDHTFAALAPDGRLLWRHTAADRFFASAAVAPDGTIVVGNHDGSVVGLTPQGQVRFRHALGAPVDASPTIDQDGVVYVAADGLWAFESTGVLRWHLPTAAALRTSPAVHPRWSIPAR